MEQLLPVFIQSGDDRVERPDGVYPEVTEPAHEILRNIEEAFPYLLFYNRVQEKPGSQVILRVDEDPLLAVWEYGNGRTAAFTADAAPHLSLIHI